MTYNFHAFSSHETAGCHLPLWHRFVVFHLLPWHRFFVNLLLLFFFVDAILFSSAFVDAVLFSSTFVDGVLFSFVDVVIFFTLLRGCRLIFIRLCGFCFISLVNLSR